MFHCDVCNKEFTSKASFMRHLVSLYDTDLKHHDYLIKYCQKTDVPLDKQYIKVTGVSYAHGRRYLHVFNPKCNHYSCIRYDGLRNRDCAHRECTSKNKSLATKGKTKSPDHARKIREHFQSDQARTRMSNTLKEKFKDKEFKEKHKKAIYNSRLAHAEGIARWQKSIHVKDEEFLKNALISLNIKFVHQQPFISKDLECIMDFYLKDLDLYVCINTDPFHDQSIHSTNEKFLKRSSYVIAKDKEIKKHLGDKVIQLYNLDEINEFINNLKKGGLKCQKTF